MIKLSLLREYVALIILLLYVVNKASNFSYDYVFNYIKMGLILSMPVLTLYPNLLGWKHASTPVTYIIYILIIDYIVNNKINHISYSLTYSVHLASLVGYLYEIPWWVNKGASFIRWTKDSFMLFDYEFISLFVILVMLKKMKWSRGKYSNIGLCLLGLYFIVVTLFYYETIQLRLYLWVKWEMLLYRLPVMISLWLVTKDIKKVDSLSDYFNLL